MVYGLFRLGRLSHVKFEAGRVIQVVKRIIPRETFMFVSNYMNLYINLNNYIQFPLSVLLSIAVVLI
ncbi:MAG: hypothetical protein LBI95_03500 [Holosporales bacterium]|nr:hypothetical protein [Holosporales bacterium]